MAPSGVVWRVLLALAGVGAGLASVRVGFPVWQVGAWLADLITGWAVIAAGIVGTLRRESLRTGVLVVLAGFAWFLGDWSTLGGAVGGIAAIGTFLHRGILFHAIFTAPSGRVASVAERGAVIAGYAASLVPWIWTNAAATAAASTLALGACALFFVRSPALVRPSKRRAVAACVVLVGGILIGFGIRAIWEGPAAASVALVVYEMAFAIAAAAIVATSVSAGRSGAGADLVVKLGTTRGGSLEGALRWALGDDELAIGYPTGVPGEFVGLRGERVVTGNRELFVVESVGREIAAIQTAAGVLADPGLRASVTAAVRLDVANRALRTEVEAQVDAVRASQRRLLEAADEEGRRLADRLHAGAGVRLDELMATLDAASQAAGLDSTRSGLDEVRSTLDCAAEDIDGLARGLHPRALDADGLAGALAAVARDAALPVELSVGAELALPSDVELAVYFFCLEALTNISKHAAASRSSITIERVGTRLRVDVRDDGVGGAELADGSGLRGVADRIGALEGTVRVVSERGLGTRLSAELPLGGPPITRSAPTVAT